MDPELTEPGVQEKLILFRTWLNVEVMFGIASYTKDKLFRRGYLSLMRRKELTYQHTGPHEVHINTR
jgi:hypothetical protein